MPNPLYQGETPLNASTICVTPAQQAEVLNYEYGVWGLDCTKNTPDDDDNDIGQDECANGMTWD